MTGSALRVVVFLQENKTTDFYFRTLAGWGADIAQHPHPLAAAPDHDQPHDRNAWVHYRMGDYPGADLQLDNDAVIPYYSWLAKTYTFCDHHFGVGTNSTPGHMMAIGGQTPTLKNPSFSGPHPTWDLPTIFTHAQRSGISWGAFPDQDGYPTKLYKELGSQTAKAHVHTSDQFLTMAAAGTLPRLCYAWSPAGFDEHPPSKSNPGYVTDGQDLIWRRVDAVVKAGQWANTVFILTWDDWGGYADHVITPNAETVVDPLHPHGFPIIGGSRIPLLMFGGQVRPGIESQWHSHASIVKTVVDLLGLPAFGVPRVDSAPTLAGRVDATLHGAPPPAHGSTISQPTPPQPTPAPGTPMPWAGPHHQPLPALVANHGRSVPAPHDAAVRPAPPKPPAQG